MKKVVMCVLAAAPSQTQEIQHCWSSDLQGQQQAVVKDSQPHQHVSVGKTHRAVSINWHSLGGSYPFIFESAVSSSSFDIRIKKET